jgi:hypothetical protein
MYNCVAGFVLLSTVQEPNLQKTGAFLDLPNEVRRQKDAKLKAASVPGFRSDFLSLLMVSAEFNTDFYGKLSKLSCETLYEVP